MANPTGELLACQPYAGAKTKIPDVGLGQGPNVVYGLPDQFGLSPGSKIACDNLFTNFDLLDHAAEREWGVLGTVRQNRIVGVPLPSKKDAAKSMVRGTMKATYDENICLIVWRDSQPVYVASNFCLPDPVGTCRRFAGSLKGYMDFPCPAMVLQYNKAMGGVDLLNQSTKCYRVQTRLKKWYWALYTWYLNVQMVQAWRLYRFTMKTRFELALEEERVADAVFEESLQGVPNLLKVARRKEREEEKKRRRKEEKKKEEMPLLDFVREVVELILDKHSEVNKKITARLSTARLSDASHNSMRFDMSRPHLVIKSVITGRCRVCNKRSLYRCETCAVCLHPDCFKDYHSP